MITKKEVNAIMDDDFIPFLKKIGLFEKYSNGEIICNSCGQTITQDNVAIIYNDGEYKFICDKEDCIRAIRG